MPEELLAQIKVVAEERKAYDRICNAKKISYQDWQDANITLLSSLLETEQRVKDAETLLRELTLKAYAETGEKAPAPGVGIREVTILTYDGKVAFDWAKAHKMALKLDVSAFEKIVKADTPDFVKVTTEPKATIATELKVEVDETTS